MTSCRKPFSTRRSRWTRLRSSERNTRRLPCWSASSTSRDSASFSFGEGMKPPMLRGSLQVYCGGQIQVYSAAYLQVNNAVLIQVYCALLLLNTVYSISCVEPIAIYGL